MTWLNALRASPARSCAAFLLGLLCWGAAQPAAAQTGPSFASDASVEEQIYRSGMAISTLTLPAATGGSGTLSYTLSSGLPAGLTFSASARTVTGTPTAGAVKADLTYTVTDTASMTDTLAVTIIVRPEVTRTPQHIGGSITNQFSTSYSMVLDAAPASDVTLTIMQRFNFVEDPPAGYEISPASMTFTPANWNTPQTLNWSASRSQGLSAGAVFLNTFVSIGGTQTHGVTNFFNVIVAPILAVSPTTVTVAEGGTATYTVVFENLQSHQTGTAVVTPVSSNTAIATVSGPLSFTRGSSGNWATAQTVTITALTIGDADTDSDSVTITHTITGQSVDAAFRGSVTVTVIDADSLRQLAIGVDESMRDEGETAVFTITLSGMAPASGTPVTVDWAVSGNVASGDSGDYSITGADTDGTLSFTALGSQTLSVAITDDATSEGEETLTITLSNAAAADIATAAATTNIHESDRPLTMQARPQSRSVGDAANLTEGTAVTFVVESAASTITTAPIEVDWTITFPAASATVNPASNADFQTRTGTVTIAIQPTSGVPQGGASITAIADGLNEPMENFVFTISNPRGGGPRVTPILSSDVSVNGTIAASDPVTASIAGPTPATAREGESVTFTITLSSASTAAVTVPWSVNELSDANLIATTSGTLTFAALTTTLSQDIVIPIGESETLTSASPTETLTATIGTLSGGHGALSGGGSTTDVTVSFTSADHTIAFTNPATALAEDSGATTYTVTRSGPAIASGASIVVSWTYTAGTTSPAAAADFAGGVAPAGGMLTFTGSASTQTFSIAIADDAASEDGETFTLGLTATDTVLAANGGVALGADIGVTIGESDRPVTISIAAPSGGALSEGMAADFEVSISGGVTTTAPITATWTLSFPAASATTAPASNADFAPASRSGTASIPAGMSSANIPITVLDDAINEAVESFTVTLSNPGGGGAIAAAALHQTDDEASAQIAASDDLVAHIALTEPSSGGVNEGARATFSVTLRTGLAADAPTATSAGEICVPFNTEVQFPQSPANTAGDGADIALVAPDNGTCAARGTPVTVPLTNRATASMLIPVGRQSATFQIEARFDNIDEGTTDESLIVMLLDPVSRSGAGAVTIGNFTRDANVNINNINAARSLAIAPPAAAVDEGGNLVFTASLTGAPVTTAFTVNWSVTTGSADVTPTSGTLNFAAGVTMQAITLAATDDAVDEADETITVTLSDPCPASPAVCGVGGRPDGLPASAPTLRLTTASANGTIAESDHPVTLSVTAPGGLTEGTAANFAVGFAESVTTTAPVTATWTLSFPGTGAASAADFAAATGTATIPAGASSVNIPITATADAVNEAAETFTFTLSNPAGGGAIAAPVLHATPSASASITASDPITARITRSSSAAVNEGGDVAFTVALALTSSSTTAATSAAPICVTFTTAMTQSTTLAADASPNTAQNPDIAVDTCSGAAVTVMADGSSTGGGVTIPAGQSSATLAITARFDNEDEGSNNETLTVTLSGATHTGLTGAAALTADTTAATAEIANSNALRTLAVSPPATAVDEDSVTADGQTAMATFTITMGGSVAPETDVVVPWSLTSPDRSLTLPSASGLARTFHTTDLAPGQAQRGTVTFPAGTALTPPATRTVSVQIAQDALNEGAEQLQLQIGMVPQTAGCTGTPTVPCTLVADRMAQATVAASDDITIFLAPAGDQGTLLAGDSARYVMSFGSTTVNGQAVPIVPTAPLTVQVMVDVGGRTSMIPVTVQANEPTAEVTVPAATINPPGQTGTPTLTVSIGTLTGAPSGATARAGTQADVDALPPNAPNRPAAPAPAPRQTAGWDLAVTRPSGAEAPEGAAYQVVFTLDGAADELSANGLTIPWSIAPRTATGGRMAEAADFAPSTSTPPAYTCGAVNGVCATLPVMSGPVTFTTGESSQTLEIRIRDDGDNENMMPDGFTLTLGPLGGADASRTVATGSLSSTGSLPLEVTIPALRADLSVANATAAEGANAVFALTLANFSGGTATTLPVTVTYTLGGGSSDTATRGADYTAGAAAATAEIAAGADSAVIAIPLLQDGVLEPRETFTLTITDATGGGGSIRLVNAEGAEQQQISATGTITDDADQSARRKQRVGALVSVLDRQTAIMATDAITARLERNRTAASTQLSIANRNLLGSGSGAQSADDSDIGLALYGAAGLGGATAGLPGGGGGSTSGMGGNYTGGAGGGGNSDAFAGLGAGLAGGANMGSQTALPSLAELMNGSSFAFQVSWWPPDINLPDLSTLAEGVQVWGSGGFANLKGNPQNSRATLDYDGDSLAFFIGADRPVRENLLAGFALGWASGDLDFTDRAGDFRMDGSLSNDMLSLHPYLGWQVTPNLNAWLVLGFGFGSVDISENEGSGASRISRTLNGGDSDMLMFSTGFAGRRQFANATELKLRFEVTRVSSEVDAARFNDGALLPGTRGSNLRLGGELELGRRYTLAGGITLRPFGTLGLRLDNSDSASATSARRIDEGIDLGGGVTANWPELGLDGRAQFSLQLNNTGHEEQRFSVDLNFDPGADSQGITLAVQTALRGQRSGLPASAGLGGLGGGSSLGRSLAGGAGGMQRSISGELGYGMALRQFGRAALLTPYGRFNLGSADQRWAAGLRLAQPGNGSLQLGIEAGLDLESAAATSGRSYDLLLTGRLHF